MPVAGSGAAPIASGSSRASMAGAGTAPGGTGAGRYVTLVSCPVPGPPRGQTPGSEKTADVGLWLRRDAGNKDAGPGAPAPAPLRGRAPSARVPRTPPACL